MADGGEASRWENWSESTSATPREHYHPETETELVDIVERHAPGDTIRVVGAGHSSTDLAVTDDVLVSMDRYTGIVSVDEGAARATVRAGTRLEDMNRELARHGLAMENMGDIDQQRLAGAIATGTHGTGTAFGSISTQVAAMRLVTSSGDVIELSPDDDPDRFRAAQVSLGALGIVSTVTLDLLPAYRLEERQTPMGFEEVLSRLGELREANRHFEFFWYPEDDVARVKTLNETDRTAAPVQYRAIDGLRGLAKRVVPASVRYSLREHTSLVFDEVDVGPSHEVFPSVRDIKFNEMEYALPREEAPEAARRIRELALDPEMDVTFPIEFRDVAADDVFLSPAHDRETTYVAVHKYHEKPYETFFDRAEEVFREYDGRPHWGKHHSLSAPDLEPLYPRWDDFRAVRRDLDPDGIFLNDYLRDLLGE